MKSRGPKCTYFGSLIWGKSDHLGSDIPMTQKVLFSVKLSAGLLIIWGLLNN